MKKIENQILSDIQAGGCGNLANFDSGALAGWGLAGVIVGGAAAASGVGLVVVGIVLSAYCS